MRCLLALALATGLLAPASAHAAWAPGGQLVMTPENGFNGVRAVRFLELPAANELAVVGVGNGGSAYGYSLQHVRLDGSAVPGWPAEGLSLWQVGKTNEFHMHGFASDDSGNVWHSFATTSAGRIHLATPSALAIPSSITPWSTPGFGPTRAHVAPGSAGDVYYVPANGRVVRFLRSGLVAAGWPANGIAIGSTGSGNTEILRDGEGGAIAFGFNSSTGGRAFVTRLDATGARHAGWPAGGLTLGTDSLGDVVATTPAMMLLRSGPSHFLAVWQALETPTFFAGRHRVFVQRFSRDGTLDPAWPAAGRVAVAMDTIRALTVVPDSSGGVFLLWLRSGLPRGTHVRADGTFAPGLDGSGVSLVDANAQYVAATYPTANVQDELPATLSPNGHLIFAWGDARLAAPNYRVRWLRDDLTPDSAAPSEGVVYFPASPFARTSGLLGIHHDGASGVLLAWADLHDAGGITAGDIWMGHVDAPPLLDAPPPSPRASALALAAPRPNPARGRSVLAFSLPDAAPARVELLDVAGRVLHAQPVSGAGAHEVVLDRLERFPAGLYFIRVATARDSRTTRIVLTR